MNIIIFMIKLLRAVEKLWARGIWILNAKKIYARLFEMVALASAMLIKYSSFSTEITRRDYGRSGHS